MRKWDPPSPRGPWRGHHAVVFIGRAHFDDPGIFDKNFEF
jgi:hypothetical protein